MTKFQDLIKKYRSGTLAVSDLEGVEADDWLRCRMDESGGSMQLALDREAFTGMKKGTVDEDGIDYVMVTDDLIPPFKDRVVATGWDLSEFKYRGSTLLYDHNVEESRPPIGTMSGVKRNVPIERQGKKLRALTGAAHFASAEIYPFGAMIGDMVKAGLLRGGSVGFTIVDARPATEDEQEKEGMGAYSSVFTKTRLFEFSITPIGRDVNAQKMANDGLCPIEQTLADFAEHGIYPDETIGRFRQDLMEVEGRKTRFQIQRPYLEADTVDEKVEKGGTLAAFNSRLASVEERVDRKLAYIDSAVETLHERVDAMAEEMTEAAREQLASFYEEVEDRSKADAADSTDTPEGADGATFGGDLYDAVVEMGFDPSSLI